MRLRSAAALLSLCLTGLVAASACEVSGNGSEDAAADVDDGRPSEAPKQRSSPTPTKKQSESPEPQQDPADTETGSSERYGPNEPLPSSASELAAALEEVHRVLSRRVRVWLAAGGRLDTPRARGIELAALFQQRLYRNLVRSPRRADVVLTRLSGTLRRRATTNFEAGHRLSAGLDPVKPPVELDTSEPVPPQRLLRFYELAEERFGVPWTVLASVNFVETRFGRILGPSSAGALGPMQFLPTTWERYGAGGDIMDPHDAILGAARYLRASGALSDIRGALFAYNQSTDYVDSVLDYAQQMRRRPNSFYEYYFWQVFVRTTKGDVQLTGPGADPQA